MALVTPAVGECELLDKCLKDALSVDESYTLKLYKTDVTPSGTSVAGDFTVADFTDYANKTLTRAGWSAAATVSNKAESEYAQQSWTCGATGNTIYGYYVIGTTSGTLLWAEKFSSARVLAENDVLNLTPKFSLNSEN